MELSFVANVNHFPQSDYSCKIKITTTVQGVGSFTFDPEPTQGMSCFSRMIALLNESKVDFYYMVNTTQVKQLTIPKN